METSQRLDSHPTIEQLMPTIEKMLDLYGEERTSFFWAREGRVLHAKESKAKGKVPKYLNRGHIYRHLLGDYAVCVLGSPDGSRFTCFDVDSGGWEMAAKVIGALRDMGVPKDRIYVSTSGGKGYHVEMFYDDKISYMDQRMIYRKMLAMIGATAHEVEFRPTHTQAIKLPLSRHHKTGNWCWYLELETGTPYEGSEHVFNIEKMDASLIDAIARKIEAEDWKISGVGAAYPDMAHDIEENTPSEARERMVVEYEAIDLTDLPKIRRAGERHHLTMRIAMACRAKGLPGSVAMEFLKSWYDEQDKGITQTPRCEALDDIESAVNWVYSRYKPPAWENGERKKAKFTRHRAEQILSVTGLTAKAILFHTYIWTACSGYNLSTEAEMARMYGVSEVSVFTAKKKLVENGALMYKVGKRVRREGNFKMERSTLSEGELKVKAEVPEAARKSDYAEVDPVQMHRDFWPTFFDAMFAVADRNWVITKLGKRERDKLAEMENERKQADGKKDESEAFPA